MQINRELQAYIENNIFPEYEKNEKGHGIDHIKYVIDRSFELSYKITIIIWYARG